MTQDRFDAQLRQHLVDTANERPADGQLASIVDRVAVAPQRPRLVARLTMLPERVGPFPAAPIRWGLVAAALVGSIIAGAYMVGSSTPVRPSTVFEGTWTSIDTGDGSTQFLVIGEGSTPDVRYVDQLATGAACRADTVKVFTAEGRGNIVGNQMLVVWPDGGGCGLLSIEMGSGTYAYDAASGSIVDGTQLTWTRVRGEPPVPTRAPAPERTPAPTVSQPEPTAPAASQGASCVQFDGPGRYSAAAGSMTLTVDVPGSKAAPWQAIGNQFSLLASACTDERARGFIDATEATAIQASLCTEADVEVSTATDAVAAVVAAQGISVLEQSEVTIAGYTGTRVDIFLPGSATSCDGGLLPLVNGLRPLGPGANFALFILDVEGRPLVVQAGANPDEEPALSAQVADILASMEIRPD